MYWISPVLQSTQSSVLDLDTLSPFMLQTTTKNHIIEKCQQFDHKETTDSTIPQTPTEEVIEDPLETKHVSIEKRLLHVKKCEDPLFWSLYVAKHGYNEYLRIGRHNGNEEMKEKKMITENALQCGSKQMTSLLNTKMTKAGLNQMVEDLLTKPKTPMSCIYLYGFYYGMNIFMVDLQKKTYLSFVHEHPETKINVVLYRNHEPNKPKYYIDTEEQYHSMEHICMNFISLHSYDKPLKAASNYKMPDLEMMAHILELDTNDGKKWKKQALYETIALKCVWDI